MVMMNFSPVLGGVPSMYSPSVLSYVAFSPCILPESCCIWRSLHVFTFRPVICGVLSMYSPRVLRYMAFPPCILPQSCDIWRSLHVPLSACGLQGLLASSLPMLQPHTQDPTPRTLVNPDVTRSPAIVTDRWVYSRHLMPAIHR